MSGETGDCSYPSRRGAWVRSGVTVAPEDDVSFRSGEGARFGTRELSLNDSYLGGHSSPPRFLLSCQWFPLTDGPPLGITR